MIFKTLSHGTFKKRYKRFFTDVELDDGSLFTVHCPNTGSMKTLIDRECVAWFSINDDPKRKLKGTLEFLEFPKGIWAMVNTHRANELAYEFLTQKKNIPAEFIKREVKYGSENSRIDLLVQEGTSKTYVEVKSVTLYNNSLHQFPDAVTTRGAKHLRELIEVVKNGDRAVLFLTVNRTEKGLFDVARSIDPAYADVLNQAIKEGVEIWCFQIKVKADKNAGLIEAYLEDEVILHPLLQGIQ